MIKNYNNHALRAKTPQKNSLNAIWRDNGDTVECD